MPATRTHRGDTPQAEPAPTSAHSATPDITSSTAAPTRPAWAHYLIDLRTRRGLPAKDVAARLGISASTYAGMEAGVRTRAGVRTEATLKDDTVHRLIAALDLTTAEARHLITLIATSAGNRSPWQARLKLARVSAGVTAAQAARAAGVTEDTYREWERKGSGAPRRHLLRHVLTLLGWDATEVDEFMATVPSDAPAVRAPRQPSNPIADLPAWSQAITEARLQAGLYLSQADERIGQASVIRRFELGGWPRVDGRLSVPTSGWLDRISSALDMNTDATARLHRLADEHRVRLAHHGATLHQRPVLSELLYEARSTTDSGPRTANRLFGLPDYTWYRAEAGDPNALAQFTAPLIDTITATWGLGEPLAAALTTASANPLASPAGSPVTHTDQPADTPQ